MMIKKHNLYSNSLKSVMILSLCSVGLTAHADDWTFEVEPYAMASTIDGDASIGRVTGADVAVNFDDILEVLDLAGMIHAEAFHQSGWGMAIDYGFMELSEDISGPRGGVAEVKVRQAVLQLDAIYREEHGEGTLDYLAGFRWWDNDLELIIDPAKLPGTLSSKIEEDWYDVFVGARWKAPINDQWKYMLRGEIGGFGLEADLTSVLAAGVLYSFNNDWALDIQYKATMVDYEDGTKGQKGYFAYDTVTHGPIIGLVYNFKH